ncbi:MAG: DoxX family protein [Bacteroidetes bacterium]|nr:DoxX family protein [Bacteroidota bacterium]MDA1120290.1 DoxX family protein [Bacteroidota bacterium]
MVNRVKFVIKEKYIKIVMEIARIAVALLFIFSGSVKLLDPIGMAIKLEEYFEVFADDFDSFFHFFTPFSLYIAIFIVVLEVVLGFALLLNYQMVQTTVLLLGLAIFFTCLTYYSAVFDKVQDCGCFGDAIKLKPWESFYKDLVLTILSGIIWVNGSMYDPYIKKPVLNVLIMLIIGGAFYTAIRTVNHLPLVDFRAYKIGNNIPELMEPSEEIRYEYVMTKAGKEFRFTDYPADKSYKFKEMIILNPDAQPKITDYGVWNDDGEFTQETFVGKKLFIIIYNTEKAKTMKISAITQLVEELDDDIEAYVLTATDGETYEQFAEEVGLMVPYYYADATILKTIIRANPGLWLLQDGVVKGKWNSIDTPTAELVSSLLN